MSPDLAPRGFVCILCFRTRGDAPGPCPRCAVDRLPLSDGKVLEELRDEAERRLHKKSYREYFWISVACFVLLSPLVLFVGLLYWIVLSVALAMPGVALFRVLFPKSALAVFAERKALLRFELHGQPAPQPPGGFRDPLRMPLDGLLAWLGVRD